MSSSWLDCKTVGFSLNISKEIGKGWSKSFTRTKRASLSPVSLSVFTLVPDLLFDCSRGLEYAKMRTVSQSLAFAVSLRFKPFKVSFYLIAILALRVKSHSLQERNVLIVDSHVQKYIQAERL